MRLFIVETHLLLSGLSHIRRHHQQQKEASVTRYIMLCLLKSAVGSMSAV